jgi:hypothetical protein
MSRDCEPVNCVREECSMFDPISAREFHAAEGTADSTVTDQHTGGTMTIEVTNPD